MPLKVLFAIDPGASGAVAVFHDGELARVFRLPKHAEHGVDVERLGGMLRDEIRACSGAAFEAVLEHTRAIPAKDGRKRGGATTATFFRTIGKLEGVLACLRIPVRLVYPEIWKRRLGLLKQDKAASRAAAAARWPWLDLSRVNSADLAEAALIGAWHLEVPA